MTITEIFAQMNGGKYFCTLDVSNAYLHVLMDEESAKLQAISTQKGIYQVNRLMFGVKVAPAIWNKFMSKLLQSLEGVQSFFDDIIIQGRTIEELLGRLKQVLQQMRNYNLRVNREKSKFCQSSIKYLGHIIDKDGLHKADEQIEAIKKARTPANHGELRTFLGIANYYNRFIPNLATILNPMNKLLQKNIEFKWSEECERSFKRVIREITSDRVLTHFDPKLPLVLATDASPVGLGAVLSHRYKDGSEKPIAFASRALSKSEARYSQIDKEATGIYWGIKKFFQYVYGIKFILITDHKPLVSIFDPHRTLPTVLATRIFNYAHFLSGLDYKVEFKRTTEHANADYLSRFPYEKAVENKMDECATFQSNQIDRMPVNKKEIRTETENDGYLNGIRQRLEEGRSLREMGLRDNEYTLQDGCIFRGIRITVPTKLQPRVMQALHEGHVGMVKMKALARSYCYWKNIDKQIEEMVGRCKRCCLNRNEPSQDGRHPWEETETPWERIHIDFAGPTNGRYYFIIVDAYSKWVRIPVIPNNIYRTYRVWNSGVLPGVIG